MSIEGEEERAEGGDGDEDVQGRDFVAFCEAAAAALGDALPVDLRARGVVSARFGHDGVKLAAEEEAGGDSASASGE